MDNTIQTTTDFDRKNRPIKPGTTKNASELYDWIDALITAVVAIVLVFALLVRLMGVEGPSMQPTLYAHHRVLVSNLFYTPKRGDIIVLRHKEFREEPLVKRIIAIEGDELFIDYEEHKVYLNGKLLDEPYIAEPTALNEGMPAKLTVPPGCVFVMGDNRNQSSDSRKTTIGFIDKREIIGRVLFRVWPLDKIGVVR